MKESVDALLRIFIPQHPHLRKLRLGFYKGYARFPETCSPCPLFCGILFGLFDYQKHAPNLKRIMCDNEDGIPPCLHYRVTDFGPDRWICIRDKGDCRLLPCEEYCRHTYFVDDYGAFYHEDRTPDFSAEDIVLGTAGDGVLGRICSQLGKTLQMSKSQV